MPIKYLLPKVLTFVVLLVLGLFISNSTSAVSLEECEKKDIPADKVSECIEVLSNKVTELGEQKKTLSSQIAQFDNQIRLTQLKISDAQATIDRLEKEIGVLGFKIGYITDSVERLEVLLKQRIVATYQQSFISNFELLLTSRDFSDLVLRVQYLKQVQENDRRLLANLQETKSNYANQKDEREDKQAAIEENKKKLLGLKASLDTQKAEKKAIVAAFSQAVSRLNSGEGDGVSEGSTIALLGNSGGPDCSSGPHLHFTVLKNSSPQDPAQYLKDVSPGWDNSPDGQFGFSGSWNWPISSPRITQGFGMSYWAKLGWYNGNIHDGIDMTGGSTISAPRSGKLIYGSTTCGNSALKYAAIKHNDDSSIITLYLHIQ